MSTETGLSGEYNKDEVPDKWASFSHYFAADGKVIREASMYTEQIELEDILEAFCDFLKGCGFVIPSRAYLVIMEPEEIESHLENENAE